MLKKLNFIFFIFITCTLGAQQIKFFGSGKLSAEPYGGIVEMENLVKQELVYPKTELEQKKGGSIYIQFKVNDMGKVIEQRIINSDNENLNTEALRVFNKIVWVADKNRESGKISYDKIQFIFSPQKYKRIVKKRGYDELPLQKNSSNSSDYFTTRQLDEVPALSNGEKIGVYVSKNIKYPSIAYERGLSGKVSVEFIIEPYGKATNIRIIKAQGGGFNGETIRLIKSIDWQAGIKNGEAVRTFYKYDISFIHPGGVIR